MTVSLEKVCSYHPALTLADGWEQEAIEMAQDPDNMTSALAQQLQMCAKLIRNAFSQKEDGLWLCELCRDTGWRAEPCCENDRIGTSYKEHKVSK